MNTNHNSQILHFAQNFKPEKHLNANNGIKY